MKINVAQKQQMTLTGRKLAPGAGCDFAYPCRNKYIAKLESLQ